jgi:hypothetical protein
VLASHTVSEAGPGVGHLDKGSLGDAVAGHHGANLLVPQRIRDWHRDPGPMLCAFPHGDAGVRTRAECQRELLDPAGLLDNVITGKTCMVVQII